MQNVLDFPRNSVKSSTCWWGTSKKAVNDVRPLEEGDSGQLLWKEMKIQGSGLAFRMKMKKERVIINIGLAFLLKLWANNSQLKDICKQIQRQLSQ